MLYCTQVSSGLDFSNVPFHPVQNGLFSFLQLLLLPINNYALYTLRLQRFDFTQTRWFLQTIIYPPEYNFLGTQTVGPLSLAKSRCSQSFSLNFCYICTTDRLPLYCYPNVSFQKSPEPLLVTIDRLNMAQINILECSRSRKILYFLYFQIAIIDSKLTLLCTNSFSSAVPSKFPTNHATVL